MGLWPPWGAWGAWRLEYIYIYVYWPPTSEVYSVIGGKRVGGVLGIRTRAPPRAIIIAYYDGARWRFSRWKPIITTRRYSMYNTFLYNVCCTTFSVQHPPAHYCMHYLFLYNSFCTTHSVQYVMYDIVCTKTCCYNISCTTFVVQHFLYNTSLYNVFCTIFHVQHLSV